MKFSLGIDLGTTNSALSYVPLDSPGQNSSIFPVPQRDSPSTETTLTTLPSFLHLPTNADADTWIVGSFARKLAADRAASVIHSAKSWLCHHGIDRTQPILPWQSQEIPPSKKLSPIQASAQLLRHLRDSWNAAHPDAPFHQQSVTLTVPASFDAVAQKLTLQAAALAEFPDNVRLLEEPQAAFYRWLEAHPGDDALRTALPGLLEAPQHVLVIDVGGGTSDFSLFEITATDPGQPPAIKRLAVSDHILLGGDNVDLALAHLLEPRLSATGEPGTLNPGQWTYLVARCRDLKERILSEQTTEAESLSISVPSTGSGLLAGTLAAEVRSDEILTLLLDGFFPTCNATSKVKSSSTGLREIGLPYATDSAITRHLAAFLQGRPTVNAILCNGGTLIPARLREHLVDLVGQWQDHNIPTVLDNPEPDLAVARGAAHYGLLCHTPARPRIQAGAARSIYLEVGTTKRRDRRLLCILPRGTEPELDVLLDETTLRLRVNTRVEFKPWYSTRRSRDQAGAVVPLDPTEFHPLPPLRTTAHLPKNQPATADGQVPIHLRTRLNAVGILQVDCLPAAGPADLTWPLEFDLLAVQQQADAEQREEKNEQTGGLRKLMKISFGKAAKKTTPVPTKPTPPTPPPTPSLPLPPADDLRTDPGIAPDLLAEARTFLATTLQNPGDRRHPVTTTRLIRNLEQLLESPKQDWNGTLVRGLWPALEESFQSRTLSIDHEATWMALAGYLLRPGYGAPGDPARIDALWRLHEEGLAFPKKGQQIQAHVLWRRVAGGLDAKRQAALLKPHRTKLRAPKAPPAELVLLAGALERLDPDTKRELLTLFLRHATTLAAKGAHAAPFFAALTGLLSRTPLHAGPETVLPPGELVTVFAATRELDWTTDVASGLQTLFLRAARLTGDRHLDLPRPLSKDIISKLAKSRVDPAKLTPLRELIPLATTDRARLFGESLPPGISFDG